MISLDGVEAKPQTFNALYTSSVLAVTIVSICAPVYSLLELRTLPNELLL